MHSNRLPPFTPPRSSGEDRAILIEELTALGDMAGREGTLVFLEPLNRYEDHMVNTLQQGLSIAEAAGAEVKLLADTYHMNIEEDSPIRAIKKLASTGMLGHVHLSDSNRHQPGEGHIDFSAFLAVLADSDYDGYCAIECRWRGEPDRNMAAVVNRLRSNGGW